MAVPMKVELFYGGQWNDETSRVRASDRIVITRGKPPFGRGSRPAECRLSFKNHDGRFSPRYHASALHGLIGRGSRLRVSVDNDVRFVGAIPRWPVRSRGSGKDVYVPVVAYGPTHRLSAGGTRAEAQSAYHRYLQVQTVDAWWPMAEGPIADGLASAVGGLPLTIGRLGAPIEGRAGALSPWLGPASVQLPNRVAADGYVAGSSASEWTVDCLYRIHGPRGDNLIITLRAWYESGTGVDKQLALRVWGANTTTPNSALFTYPDVSTQIGSSATISGDQFRGDALHHIRMRAVQSGSNVIATGYVDGVQVVQVSYSGTLQQLKRCGIWYLDEEAGNDTFTSSTPVSVGHLVAYGANEPSLSEVVDAAFGHQGEQAHERILRVAAEEGLTATVGSGPSAALGPQPYGSGLDAMQDAATADGGYLLDDRDTYGFTYRDHTALLNPTPDATLDYAAGEVLEFDLDEEESVANVYTVKRRDGGEATVERSAGPVGTGTLGRMPQQEVLTLDTDDQARHQAGWRSHVSTWDAPRVERVSADLTKLEAQGKTTLAADLAAVDAGDVVRVDNPPAWAGTIAVDFVVDGSTETIESHRRYIEWYGHPAEPYHVGVLDTSLLTVAGTILDETLTLVETDADINYGDDGVPFTSTVPFDVVIGGERMTVTNVAPGVGTRQVLTVVRGVNGVVTTHVPGEAVHIYRPLRLAREG